MMLVFALNSCQSSSESNLNGKTSGIVKKQSYNSSSKTQFQSDAKLLNRKLPNSYDLSKDIFKENTLENLQRLLNRENVDHLSNIETGAVDAILKIIKSEKERIKRREHYINVFLFTPVEIYMTKFIHDLDVQIKYFSIIDKQIDDLKSQFFVHSLQQNINKYHPQIPGNVGEFNKKAKLFNFAPSLAQLITKKVSWKRSVAGTKEKYYEIVFASATKLIRKYHLGHNKLKKLVPEKPIKNIIDDKDLEFRQDRLRWEIYKKVLALKVLRNLCQEVLNYNNKNHSYVKIEELNSEFHGAFDNKKFKAKSPSQRQVFLMNSYYKNVLNKDGMDKFTKNLSKSIHRSVKSTTDNLIVNLNMSEKVKVSDEKDFKTNFALEKPKQSRKMEIGHNLEAAANSIDAIILTTTAILAPFTGGGSIVVGGPIEGIWLVITSGLTMANYTEEFTETKKTRIALNQSFTQVIFGGNKNKGLYPEVVKRFTPFISGLEDRLFYQNKESTKMLEEPLREFLGSESKKASKNFVKIILSEAKEQKWLSEEGILHLAYYQYLREKDERFLAIKEKILILYNQSESKRLKLENSEKKFKTIYWK